jgi:HNH endonuclease
MLKSRSKVDRNGILDAIRKAAVELGRPPHRGELPRVAGISHSVVLKHFASLRDAVRGAGLEPSRRGLKVPAEDLLRDFARVATELGHAPNRNEYVRHGKYAAGTFYANFGSWPGLSRAYTNTYHGGTETRRTATQQDSPQIHGGPGQANADEQAASKWQVANGQTGSRSGDLVIGGSGDLETVDRKEELIPSSAPYEPCEGDKAIALQWAGAMTALPGELAGKRRVTDAVCAMIVNTLIGAENDWRGQLSRYLEPGKKNHTADERGLARIERGPESNGGVSLARVNGSVTSGGIIDDERPVMGPPFYPCALSNAPVNEMGVMILFGMLAGELGFQIEAVQGRYPDILARRQIQPGRWQDVRIEAEYESRNFAQHGHDPAKCDIIVCWRHNWVKCPKHIEVIELSRVVDRVIR